MLPIHELRTLGASLPQGAFRRQLGPFVLIQRPLGPGVDPLLTTTRVATIGDIEQGMLSLIFEFEDLLVTTLPPLSSVEELTVGRLPDCDLVLDDASVSKRHAMLRWSEPEGRCTVRDLGSTNGTFLNASSISDREVPLRDGDIISFGNVQFWYLLVDTLYARLRQGSQARSLRSHSG